MELRQSIDFSINEILDSSLNDAPDGSSKLMVAATSFIHEHTETKRPV
jgi:hypothetical protein